MSAEIKLEILSKYRSLVGLVYMNGMTKSNHKEIIFHEIGIGFLFFGIFVKIYNKRDL
jgi:hypothetical protein